MVTATSSIPIACHTAKPDTSTADINEIIGLTITLQTSSVGNNSNIPVHSATPNVLNTGPIVYFNLDGAFSSSEGVDSVLRDGPWMIREIPIFLNKWSPTVSLLKEELSRVPVWVKFHDVLYARVLIEINACNDFSNNMVMVVPKLEVENRMDKGNGQIPSADDEGFIEVERTASLASTNKASNKESLSNKDNVSFFISNSFEVLNVDTLIIEEVATGSKVTTFGMQVKGQCSVHLVKRTNVIEKQIMEGKLVLVDDDGKLMEKVDYPANSDNDDEVESVENKTASFVGIKGS
ncbi:zinc knuckle CX2CX4HX4C containing protein [Tanacetum coccineum]